MFLDHVSPVKCMVMGCWITVTDVSYVVWFMTNDIDLCRYLGYFVSFLFLGIGPLLDSLLDPVSGDVPTVYASVLTRKLLFFYSLSRSFSICASAEFRCV